MAGSLAWGAERESPMGADPKTITVTDKDKNTKVSLAPGDLLIVRLEAPLGEGYQWRITRNNKDLLKPLEKAPVDRLGKSPPSKVELQVFYFDAATAGANDLELEYRRPADTEGKPARMFKGTLEIAR